MALLDTIRKATAPDIWSAAVRLARQGCARLEEADDEDGGGLLAAWDAEEGHHVYIVPEPATLSLLALLALSLPKWCGLSVLRRRKK